MKKLWLYLFMCLFLSCHSVASFADYAPGQTAEGTWVDTTEFDMNLSDYDDTVQKALETLDELVSGGGEAYLGTWNASTNTPTLTDGVGTANDYYQVSVGGTIDLGSGSQTFVAGDDVLYNGSEWLLRAGVAVSWGTIGGTLSDQTDLQNALDGKLSLTGGSLTGDLSTTGDISADGTINGTHYGDGSNLTGIISGLWSSGAGTDIYYSDNVGIGNTEPTTELDVTGTITATTYAGITDNMVMMDYPSGSTAYNLDDYLNDTQSAGWVSGGAFTDDGDGTMTVASGVAVLKTGTTDTSPNVLADFDATPLSPTNLTASYVYLDYNSGAPTVGIATSNTANGKTIINLGKVFREGTTCHFFRAGQVVSNFIQRALARFNSDGEIQLKSGGNVTESTTAFTLVVAEATLYGGVIKFTTDEIDTNTTGTFEYYYTDGAGGFQYIGETETLINSTQYDNAGTLTNLPNNDYRTDFAFLTNDGDLLVMLGDDNFNTLLEAQNRLIPTSLPSHISEFSTPLAKIIVQEGESNIVEIRNIIKEDAFSTVGSVVHNDTTGKQGGTTDEYYHLTSAEATVVGNTSNTNTGDQTSIVGITGTMAQFDTAVTDGNFAYAGGAFHDGFSDYVVGEHFLQSAISIPASQISDFDTEVSNNTSVIANTAKVSNVTHTGDVTGSTDLTIATDAVDISMLSATGTASSTTYLRGDNSWATITSGGTPGGSDSQVQYNNGGSFGGDADFVWDDTNGYLGIGTSVPSGALEVVSSDATSFQATDTDGEPLFTVLSSGNVGIGTTAPSSAFEIVGDGDFNFDDGTMFIDSSSDSVGIGTSVPATLLDVNGTITVQGNGNSCTIIVDTDGTCDSGTSLGSDSSVALCLDCS